MGGAFHIYLSDDSWFPVDTERSHSGYADHWFREGNSRHSGIRHPRDNHAQLSANCKEDGLSCFFLHAVSPGYSLIAVSSWYLCSVLGYVSFFVVICYHTLYAVPWIFPPLAFYGLDIFVRMIRFRIKDAIVVPQDNQMTLVCLV